MAMLVNNIPLEKRSDFIGSFIVLVSRLAGRKTSSERRHSFDLIGYINASDWFNGPLMIAVIKAEPLLIRRL